MGIKENGSGSASDCAVNPDAAAQWSDPRVFAAAIFSRSTPFLVGSDPLRGVELAVARQAASNRVESAAPAPNPNAAARWSDPNLLAAALLGCSISELLRRSDATRRVGQTESGQTGGNKPDSPADASSHDPAARWSDPKVAAQILLGQLPYDAAGQFGNRPREHGNGTRANRQGTDLLEGGTFDEAKHPRGGNPKNRGEFSDASGGGAGTGAQTAAQPNDSDSPLRVMGFPSAGGGGKGPAGRKPNPSDPSHWFLPSDDRGTWLGAKGDSTFRLKTPVKSNGRIVKEIKYTKGLPILDQFALPGKTVAIVLTGDSNTDIANAKTAWQKLNPGKELPGRSIFHHDLLHVVEETITINGKKTKVLVGKMHLVPAEINRSIFHEGSASVARKFYRGLGIEVDAVTRLASKEASLAAESGRLVARAAKRIVPGKLGKGILPFVGRNIRLAIPIGLSGLALLEFSDNVEAHGVGGAVARAVPVLGDLISAHDLGSELAKQITDEANAALDANLQAINTPVADAWHEAGQQTIKAFHDLAPQIQVTNVYGPNGLVDPNEIVDALKRYRGAMRDANLLRATNAPDFDFDAIAARNKQELKERLTRACQKQAPPPRGPAL